MNSKTFGHLANFTLVELLSDGSERRVDRGAHCLQNGHNLWGICIVLELPRSTPRPATILTGVQIVGLVFCEFARVDNFVQTASGV
ncbi:unannotated protein [freshwater metagenome]|uniref:Unannotated protein n=1 Tax=freshwater metagenome TaxID=449393 RepID=A0A6J6BG98_9ZZZZ